MKCFYCSCTDENKNVGFCHNCGKELARICTSCGIKYDKNAKFCMSCAGKLEDLPARKSEDSATGSKPIDNDIKIEFDDNIPRGTNAHNTPPKEKDEFLEIDFGIENPDNDLKEKTLKVQIEQTPPKKDNFSFEIMVDNTPNGPELDFEKRVAEQKKLDEERPHKKTLEMINSEKANTEFITKIRGIKDTITDLKKNSDTAKSGESFDKLFEELSSLTINVEHNTADFSNKNENVDPQPAATAVVENYTIVDNEEKYKLQPRQVHETYDVSFDELISETVTPEFEESCVPMLRKIEQNFKICKGGTFFLRGQSGVGKSYLFDSISAFSQKTENVDDLAFRVVTSDANIFDFDFMIFINLIKKLMGITSDDPAQVLEKFNTLFGDALPDGKKECLAALICLNFAPLKTKLPKHDMKYLLSYVFYCLSRNKPVLWVINNANALNVRTVRFLSNLNTLFDCAPIAVLCIVDPDAPVLASAIKENIYDFSGFGEEMLEKTVYSSLGTNRIPAEIEKLLREKANGNMLFAIQLTEYLKDLGLIFEMKGSWRFSKLPDDFECPSDIEELIGKRISLLSEDLFLTLKEITLLNLYSIPREFFSVVSSTGSACVDELVKSGYLISDGDSVKFASRTIMNVLKKTIKIGKQKRAFYRTIVDKLASSNFDIGTLNKHWLLLSYINLGGIVDKKMNPFLFSSAAYMEKLGFFEIAQRSYQTIISSFEPDDTEDSFRILPEIKNARLWRIVEPQWAKIFWEKLQTYSKQHSDYHLNLLAKSEILLLDEKNVNFAVVADIIKKFHVAGCYEDEFRLIDKTTDILIGNGNHLEANTFAVRGYKLLRDVIVKSNSKGVRPAEFIYILYLRSACKLAEICIMLKNYPQATTILEEALNYAENSGISYFKSKIMFLLGKIKMMNHESWEDLIKDGFMHSLINMDFSIIKAFMHFFEEEGLENKDWVEPFLEYKNCMNF